MKKVFISMLAMVVITCASIYVVADTTGSSMDVKPGINQQIVADLNLTSVRFCNSGFENLDPVLRIDSRPGQLQNICAIFFNNLDTGMNFYVGFSEATKNKHNEWLCDDDATNNEFSKFIRDDFAATKITIQPKSQKYKNFGISIPKNTTGDIIGCLSYTIDGSYTKNTGDIFGIVVRKTAPIWITVTGDVYNYGRRDDAKYSYTDNKQNVLKIIVGVLAIRLIATIVSVAKKSTKKQQKKSTKK